MTRPAAKASSGCGYRDRHGLNRHAWLVNFVPGGKCGTVVRFVQGIESLRGHDIYSEVQHFDAPYVTW